MTSEIRSKQDKKRKNPISLYKFIKLVGSGTDGEVYLALYIPTKCYVAIKILKSKNKISIEKINLFLNLNHINIAKMIDFFENNNKYYIVFEYINGNELFDLLKFGKPISKQLLSLIVFQLIQVLKYLHNKQIFHRDLKPENILITKHNIVKLIDFDSSSNNNNNNLLKTKCGTINYCAPEILRGKEYRGAPADIWSFGVILFIMCTGTFPFNDKNENELMKKIINCKYFLPYNLNASVKIILSKIFVANYNKRMTLKEIEKTELYKYGRKIFENQNNIIYNEFNMTIKKSVDSIIKSLVNEYINRNKNVNDIDNNVSKTLLYLKFLKETNWNKILVNKEYENDSLTNTINYSLNDECGCRKIVNSEKNINIKSLSSIKKMIKSLDLSLQLENKHKLHKINNNSNSIRNKSNKNKTPLLPKEVSFDLSLSKFNNKSNSNEFLLTKHESNFRKIAFNSKNSIFKFLSNKKIGDLTLTHNNDSSSLLEYKKKTNKNYFTNYFINCTPTFNSFHKEKEFKNLSTNNNKRKKRERISYKKIASNRIKNSIVSRNDSPKKLEFQTLLAKKKNLRVMNYKKKTVESQDNKKLFVSDCVNKKISLKHKIFKPNQTIKTKKEKLLNNDNSKSNFESNSNQNTFQTTKNFKTSEKNHIFLYNLKTLFNETQISIKKKMKQKLHLRMISSDYFYGIKNNNLNSYYCYCINNKNNNPFKKTEIKSGSWKPKKNKNNMSIHYKILDPKLNFK